MDCAAGRAARPLGPAAAIGLGATAVAFWPREVAPAAPAPVVKAIVLDMPDQARLRCDSCGVISAIRTLPAADGAPAGFEFTVRVADGSVGRSEP